MFDIKAALADAEKLIEAEKNEKAQAALVRLLRKKDHAQQIVKNVEAEINDLLESIEDGSFNG